LESIIIIKATASHLRTEINPPFCGGGGRCVCDPLCNDIL